MNFIPGLHTYNKPSIIASFLILFLLIPSCNEPIKFTGWNLEDWQNDIGGCQNIRFNMMTDIQEHMNELIGYDQAEITRLLGKPDEVILYKRSQKFYVYNLSPGTICENSFSSSTGKDLHIKFSALELCNEAFIINRQPVLDSDAQ